MKAFFIAGLLALGSVGAMAQDEIHHCGLIGNIYETAAYARKLGHDPEMALSMVSPYQEIPIEDRKRIVNSVYFEPAFERAGGTALQRQMMDLCMYGPKKFKPLK